MQICDELINYIKAIHLHILNVYQMNYFLTKEGEKCNKKMYSVTSATVIVQFQSKRRYIFIYVQHLVNILFQLPEISSNFHNRKRHLHD